MTFIWPSALLLLLVVAGLAMLYVLAQRRRNRYALRYANISLVREAIGKGPGWHIEGRTREEEHAFGAIELLERRPERRQPDAPARGVERRQPVSTIAVLEQRIEGRRAKTPESALATGTTAIAAFRQHLRSRPAKALRLLVPKKHSA